MAEEIMTSKEGSFARFTITDRVPGILKDLLENNRFSPETEGALRELLASIPGTELTPLSSDYPFASDINGYLKDHPGSSWLKAPFLFVENYLYHRIADICGFFSNRRDYFLYKKEAEFRKGLDKFSENLKTIPSVESFSEICLLNLMGNRADLSQNGSYYSADSASELLIDHREDAARKISKSSRVDIILDNAGEELFFDLLMAYWLLSRTDLSRVKLHFKKMPYFVSDALITDYRILLDILSEREDCLWFADTLRGLEEEGRLVVDDDPFFVNGMLYNCMPRDLAEDLAGSDLLIFKGDLNYRRLVGDKYWPYEKKTSSIIDYFPADIMISRILKCEVAVGLDPESVPDRDKTDWMFNGSFGLIDYIRGTENE